MRCSLLPSGQRSAHDGAVKPGGSKKAVFGIIAFFLLGGLGFVVGAGFAWSDEHSGTAGTARIVHCTKGARVKNTANVSCDATWVYNGRTVTGWVQNARLWRDGHELPVRIHGTGHVTRTTYWIPIGLAIFGVLTLALAVWLTVLWRRRLQPT